MEIPSKIDNERCEYQNSTQWTWTHFKLQKNWLSKNSFPNSSRSRSTLMHILYLFVCILLLFALLCAFLIPFKWYISSSSFFVKLLPIYFGRNMCVCQCIKSITSNKKEEEENKTVKMGWLLLNLVLCLCLSCFLVVVVVVEHCTIHSFFSLSQTHLISSWCAHICSFLCVSMCILSSCGLLACWLARFKIAIQSDLVHWFIPLICVCVCVCLANVDVCCRSPVKTTDPKTGFHMSFNR